MPHNRYFTEEDLNNGDQAVLEGTEFHHLSRVMRIQVGEKVELVNGRGILAHATLEKLGKEEAILQIHQIESKPKKAPSLILAQALPRLANLEFILEKGTELGADAFWLFPGMLSEKETLSENQKQRLNTILISSMKQCGRLDLPEILLKPPLKQWEPLEGSLYFGDLRESAPPYKPSKEKSPLIFFIGPEKGFHEQEKRILEDSLNAKGVKLHDNILRTETASLVALSLSN